MSLRADDLSLRIGSRTLVQALSFTLAPGQCCALLGRNGAGKSSLLLALAGLRGTEAGRVSWSGETLQGIGRPRLARHIGSLLQDEYDSFWGSTLDYVALGALHRGGAWGGVDEIARAAAAQALTDMELEGHAQQSYRTLSAGERQRARFAQLLVQDTAVLLLDEPLAHLDLRHQGLVAARIRQLAEAGRSVLMALHEPYWAARCCDSALLLYDSGRFLLGSAADVLTQDHLEALYGCTLQAVPLQDRTLLFPA